MGGAVSRLGQSGSINEDYQRSTVPTVPELRPLRCHLPEAPRRDAVAFPCLRCIQLCFDGNIPKKLQCGCGQALFRAESGDVVRLEKLAAIQCFADLFDTRLPNSLPSGISDLNSVTFAVFEDSVPPRFRSARGPDFSQILTEVLLFFFSQKQRCVCVNDLLQVCGIRLKVTNAVPPFGIITADTAIQCFEVVGTESLRRVQVQTFWPERLDERRFWSIIAPYFREQKFVHLHVGQVVNTPDLSFLIVAADPSSGLLCATTDFYINSQQLQQVSTISFEYCCDRMPQELSYFPPEDLSEVLSKELLAPFLDGHRRIVYAGCEFWVCGVWLRVKHCAPTFGYATEDSQRLVTEQEDMQSRQLLVRLLLRLRSGESLPIIQNRHEEAFAALPTTKLSVVPRNEESKKCLICIEEYRLNEDVTTLPCCECYIVHMFHTGCIQSWLKQSEVCPICKNNVQKSLRE